MISKSNVLLISVVLTAIWCCWATTSASEQVDDSKNNGSTKTEYSDNSAKLSDMRYKRNKCFRYICVFIVSFFQIAVENTLIIYVFQRVSATTVQHTNVPIIRQIWVAQSGV